jgi:crossover junction endodeoxyribonuclease RuvC
MIYIGVDPGFTGAIAFINGATLECEVIDTPILRNGKRPGKRGRPEFIPISMAGLIRDRIDLLGGHSRLVIELVSARPREGCVSSFRFGFGAGLWHGIAAGLEIPVITVTPQAWKSYFRLGKDKEKSLILARRLFPSCAYKLKRKKDHNRAEALLIAEWARRALSPVTLIEMMDHTGKVIKVPRKSLTGSKPSARTNAVSTRK